MKEDSTPLFILNDIGSVGYQEFACFLTGLVRAGLLDDTSTLDFYEQAMKTGAKIGNLRDISTDSMPARYELTVQVRLVFL